MKILIYKIKKIIIKRFKNIYLEIKVWFISRQIIKSGKTFLFIDCGSNLGQGFKFFRKYFTLDIFDYILIEPNPNCIKELKKLTNKKITLIIIKVETNRFRKKIIRIIIEHSFGNII